MQGLNKKNDPVATWHLKVFLIMELVVLALAFITVLVIYNRI